MAPVPLDGHAEHVAVHVDPRLEVVDVYLRSVKRVRALRVVSLAHQADDLDLVDGRDRSGEGSLHEEGSVEAARLDVPQDQKRVEGPREEGPVVVADQHGRGSTA